MSEVNLDPTVNSCFNFYQANMNNVAVPVPFIDFTKTETNIYQQSLKKFDDETTTTTDEKSKLTFFIKLVQRIQASKMELYKKNENARINSLTSQVNNLSTQINQIQGSNNECNQRINSLNQHYADYKNSSEAEIRTLTERLKQICPK